MSSQQQTTGKLVSWTWTVGQSLVYIIDCHYYNNRYLPDVSRKIYS